MCFAYSFSIIYFVLVVCVHVNSTGGGGRAPTDLRNSPSRPWDTYKDNQSRQKLLFNFLVFLILLRKLVFHWLYRRTGTKRQNLMFVLFTLSVLDMERQCGNTIIGLKELKCVNV